MAQAQTQSIPPRFTTPLRLIAQRRLGTRGYTRSDGKRKRREGRAVSQSVILGAGHTSSLYMLTWSMVSDGPTLTAQAGILA